MKILIAIMIIPCLVFSCLAGVLAAIGETIKSTWDAVFSPEEPAELPDLASTPESDLAGIGISLLCWRGAVGLVMLMKLSEM